MIESLYIFAVGALIAAGLHRSWFNTQLPVHVFKGLRYFGWGAHKDWPNPIDLRHWLRHECETWFILNTPHLVGELLTCPVCFSYHLSFWVALAMFTVGCPPWIMFVWPAWPEIINLLPGHKGV